MNDRQDNNLFQIDWEKAERLRQPDEEGWLNMNVLVPVNPNDILCRAFSSESKRRCTLMDRHVGAHEAVSSYQYGVRHTVSWSSYGWGWDDRGEDTEPTMHPPPTISD